MTVIMYRTIEVASRVAKTAIDSPCPIREGKPQSDRRGRL